MLAVFYWIAFPALGLCVACALYGSPREWFAGSGKRRFTRASAAQMADEIGTLSMQLAEAKRPKTCVNCGHLTGWPTGAELADSDRSDPAGDIRMKAPVDAHGAQALKPDTVPLAKPGLLTGLVAQDPEATQSLGVQALRDAAAMDAGHTATLPAVSPVVAVLPEERRRTTWGIKDTDAAAVEAWALGTAPGPLTSATSVPVGLGERVSVKVEAVVTEAAS